MINYVHYKDWNGEPEFALMGKGKVDLLAITHGLKTVIIRAGSFVKMKEKKHWKIV